MKAERSEIIPLLDEELKKKQAQNFRLIEQAAVQHEKLTHDPNWDIFLQEVQALINMTEEVRDGFKDQLTTRKYLNPEELEEIRHQALIHDIQATTLQTVIDLPKEIVVMGEKVSLFL